MQRELLYWAICRIWEAGFHRRLEPLETHPGHGGIVPEHDELGAWLNEQIEALTANPVPPEFCATMSSLGKPRPQGPSADIGAALTDVRVHIDSGHCPAVRPGRLMPSTATQARTLNKPSTTRCTSLPMLRKRRRKLLHCECIQGPPQPANTAERRFGRYEPTRMRCSMLAAGPPARALRVPDGGVGGPAMLFHGPIVSTMIFIPATALSI